MNTLTHHISGSNTTLAILVAALVLSIVAFGYLQRQASSVKPLPGFPLVGLEGDGLSPRDAWSQHGLKVQAKGLREHSGAFQVMTATGPKAHFPL